MQPLAFDVQWWYDKIVLILREHSRCGSVVLAAWDFIVLLVFPPFSDSLAFPEILSYTFLLYLNQTEIVFLKKLA